MWQFAREHPVFFMIIFVISALLVCKSLIAIVAVFGKGK